MSHIEVNGERREIEEGATVADLLRALEMPEDGVAVAVEREVVPRSRHAEHVLQAGARVEVIRAVGGG